MSGKKIIYLVEGIIIVLLITAISFFYQVRLTSKVLKTYQNQSKQAAVAVNGLTGLVDVFKKNNEVLTAKLTGFDQEKKDLADENSALKEKSANLEEQNKSLEAQVNSLKEDQAKIQAEAESLRSSAYSGLDAQILAPVESKLKNVAVMVDSIDLSVSDKKKIQTLLSSIYKELSAVDLSIAKIVGQEPLYRERFAAKEKEMNTYYEKMKKLGKENENLTDQIKQAKNQLSGSQDKMRFLEEEQKQYQAQKDILAQNISQYKDLKGSAKGEMAQLKNRISVMQEANKKLLNESKQKSQMDADLRRLTAELKDKEDKATALESQSADMSSKYQDAQAKYDSTQKEIEKLKADIGSRSNKVLSLQDSLETKNAALTQLTAQVQDQMKEMAVLREKVVKSQLENARLSNSLKATDQAFGLLKDEMNNIGQINVKVKEYLDQASSNINAAAGENLNNGTSSVLPNKTENPVAAPQVEQLNNKTQSSAQENKEVMVNISSVEPQNVTEQGKSNAMNSTVEDNQVPEPNQGPEADLPVDSTK